MSSEKGNNVILGWIKRHPLFTGGTLAILLIVSLAGSYLVLPVFNSPGFCKVCHSMIPFSDTYELSAHGDREGGLQWDCMSCHAGDSIGPIESRFLAQWIGHMMESDLVYFEIRNILPHAEFNPKMPEIPNERCLWCHEEGSKFRDAYPVTAKNHKTPIDVSHLFDEAVKHPEGQECKFCHSFIVHPPNGELYPTEKGEKYHFKHPGFPEMDLGEWKNAHWKMMANNEPYYYLGQAIPLNKDDCHVCHVGELEPGKADLACVGCHEQKIEMEAGGGGGH